MSHSGVPSLGSLRKGCGRGGSLKCPYSAHIWLICDFPMRDDTGVPPPLPKTAYKANLRGLRNCKTEVEWEARTGLSLLRAYEFLFFRTS